jgi:hypothetical protein
MNPIARELLKDQVYIVDQEHRPVLLVIERAGHPREQFKHLVL